MVTDTKRYDDLAGTLLRSETVAGYDAADKVLSLTQKDGSGTVIDSFNYQYDVTGKVLQETSTVDPTKNYTYDLTNQLTGDGSST